MAIFEPVYSMIVELDKLEKLMPNYAEPLRFLSKTIRNKVWRLANETRLAKVLNVCNWILSILVDTFGESIEVVELYVDTLDKMSSKYTTASLHNTYASVYAHIAVCRTGDMVKEHWKQLNPYFRKEYARENLFKKDLIDILDDFFQNIVSICPNDFLMPLSNFDYLLRGRRKEWRLAQDLMPPSIEFSIAHNIINRWNPPEKRYLYLVNGIANSPENDTVCFEEMRIKKDETVTIANFHIAKAAYHKKVINLNFDDVTRQDIFDFVNVGQKKQTHDLIEQIYTQKISPTKENIKNQIELQTMETTQLACSFCGKLLLKEICDAIFVPLDSDEDNDAELKDQCYKSFHILAEYFENKGIAGIVFPSTRMRLLNKTGSNLVLFSVDDAFPDVGTYRIVKK
jgi:hypothetical protein